jgi:hypothetical protein
VGSICNPLPLDLEIEVKEKGQISWAHLALVRDKKITCVLRAHQDLSFDIQHENLSRILIGFALHCTVD